MDRIKIWNQFDEAGLLLGVPRIPGESNNDYRKRLIDRPEYSSTHQGLVNWISQALLTNAYNVAGRRIFFSLRTPMSMADYQALVEKTEDYYPPRVTVGGTTCIILPTSNREVDVSEAGGITWSLWKRADGSFEQIWTADVAPSQDVELRYMWQDDAGRLVVIHESSKMLTWQADGTITEENPDGDS